MGPAGRS